MMRIASAGTARPTWRTFAWRHPEWWSLALAALAWGAIVLGAGHPHAPAMPEHHHPGTMPGMTIRHGPDWGIEVTAWLLMVVAMMTPLVTASLATVAGRSLWRRRNQAMAGFLAGYLTVWAVAGLALFGVVALAGLDRWWRSWWVVGIAFAMAAGWQGAPARRRFLYGCHRTIPLAPRGWRANRDCLRQGWVVGRSCLVTCGPAMVACLLAGHALGIMAGITLVAIAERTQFRPDQRRHAVVLIALGAIAVAGRTITA